MEKSTAPEGSSVTEEKTESLCPESLSGSHDWGRHILPPEQCEGKTHVCVLCGAEKTEEEKVQPKVMELGTIDQAKDRGEHTEEFHEAHRQALEKAITDEKLSKFLYEVKTAYMRMIGEEVQTTWETVSQSAKDEIRSEINFVRNTLSAPPEQDKNFASKVHDMLFATRLHAGYRYGKQIDHDAKEHPDMVTYGLLPEEQKIKLFLARVLVRLTAGIQAGY